MARDRDTITDITGGDVTTDVGINSGPTVVAHDIVDSEGTTRMTAKNAIMALIEDLGTKGLRDENSTFVEDNVIFS